MLSLEMLDNTPQKLLTDERVAIACREAAPVLEAVKAGKGLDTDSMGWMDVTKWAGEQTISRLEEIAAQVAAASDAFVVIGVGGSNNAARSVVEAFRGKSGVEIIWAGNTLSPAAMNRMLSMLEGKRFTIDCIAKNFETLEPGASFRVLRQLLVSRFGKEEAARRTIATGTPGSRLEEICREEGYTFLAFPTDIGGRYTAMSNVGLLPMAVAGLDIRALVRGGTEMQKQLYTLPADENPALRYAVIRNMLYHDGYHLEMFSSFEPQLKWFYKWWIQLFAESEGKCGKGLFPVASEYSEELHSVGQFVQDGSPILFETFLDIKEQQSSLICNPDEVDDRFGYLDGKDFWEINKASFMATRTAHAQKLPCLTLTLDRLDMETFGELFYFYQFTCVLSSVLLGVNPFDQPGVEAYKGWMFKALGKPGA